MAILQAKNAINDVNTGKKEILVRLCLDGTCNAGCCRPKELDTITRKGVEYAVVGIRLFKIHTNEYNDKSIDLSCSWDGLYNLAAGSGPIGKVNYND